MRRQTCAAKLVTTTGDKYQPGKPCPEPALAGEQLCWTHNLSVNMGVRKLQDVLTGKLCTEYRRNG